MANFECRNHGIYVTMFRLCFIKLDHHIPISIGIIFPAVGMGSQDLQYAKVLTLLGGLQNHGLVFDERISQQTSSPTASDNSIDPGNCLAELLIVLNAERLLRQNTRSAWSFSSLTIFAAVVKGS